MTYHEKTLCPSDNHGSAGKVIWARSHCILLKFGGVLLLAFAFLWGKSSHTLFTRRTINPISSRRTAVVDDSTFPADLSTSAFGMELYSQIQEPYRSFPCMPKAIHISQNSNVHIIPQPKNESHFHNQTSEAALNMTVSFFLDYEKCANVTPKVMYRRGFQPEKTVEATEIPLSFTYQSTIENTSLFQSDWIYNVVLPNLEAGGHRYWYRIEVEEKNEAVQTSRLRSVSPLKGKTPNYSFLTAPLPRTPTSIALVGDLGQTVNSTKTMARIFHDSIPETEENKNPTTLLLISGDMSYADSEPMRWLSWFELMEPLTRSLTMHVAAGNHEIECDNRSYAIFVQYENYFSNPNRIAKADMKPITEDYRKSLHDRSCSTPSEFQGHYNYGNAFYSFIHGYVHFIVLSSYSESQEASPQYEWLKKELKYNFNRTETPWLVVSFHSPLYTTFLGHVDEVQAMAMKESMEPLFNEYNVNLVISGHDHGYMRSHSMSVNATVDHTGKAPIYLTLGAGGNREKHARGYRHSEPEDWVVKRDLQDYGYGHLLVVNGTHALLTWVQDGVSDEGQVDKDVWIVNHHYNASADSNGFTNFGSHEIPAEHVKSSADGTPNKLLTVLSTSAVMGLFSPSLE